MSAVLDMLFSRTCEGCGDPVAGALSGPFECAGCHKMDPAFDWARSAVRYDGVAKACLRRFKYNAGAWLLEDLVEWLVAFWRTCPGEHGAVRSVGILHRPDQPRHLCKQPGVGCAGNGRHGQCPRHMVRRERSRRVVPGP